MSVFILHVYDEIGGQLSEIGTAFSGGGSDSDSDSETATPKNYYRGSFRLQTLDRHVTVSMVMCDLASYNLCNNKSEWHTGQQDAGNCIVSLIPLI